MLPEAQTFPPPVSASLSGQARESSSPPPGHRGASEGQGEGAPLARDLDLADRLAFNRPRDIRKLIERHMAEIAALGACATVAHVVKGDWVVDEPRELG